MLVFCFFIVVICKFYVFMLSSSVSCLRVHNSFTVSRVAAFGRPNIGSVIPSTSLPKGLEGHC